MLRDSRVWWPWFDRRKVTQRRVETGFDADDLHRWTVDVMRRHDSYGHVAQAALGHHLDATLPRLAGRIICVIDPPTPLSVFDDRASELLPGAPTLIRGSDLAAFSQALTSTLRALAHAC